MKPRTALLSMAARRPGRGFTLIELVACLLILGLISGAAALSLRGLKKNVDLDSWIEQVVQLDRRARQRSQDLGHRWTLLIDLDRQLLWSQPDQGSSRDTRHTPLYAPAGWKLTGALTSQDNHRPAGGLPTHGGQVAVPVSTAGTSPTYAIHLTNTQGDEHWLLAAGNSGQWTLSNHEDPIQNIFATLRQASGDDAG